MRRWYFPAWNGDFRLVPVSESGYRTQVSKPDACVLEITDPTEAERNQLNEVLAECSKKGWTLVERVRDAADGEQLFRQEVLMSAAMDDVGKVLLKVLRPAASTITAFKSVGGAITVQDTHEVLKEEPAKVEVVDKVPEPAKAEDKKDKAVSVKRATPSCPQCVPGAVDRASEVLLDFLTPEEHETWAEARYIIVEGGLSGHRYVIAHRHSAIAAKFGRICYDLDDEIVIHFHDNTVPPEEEVLAAKLILQHREPWLRNEATALGGGDLVFKNPFGDGSDGVPDASFSNGFGTAILAALRAS